MQSPSALLDVSHRVEDEFSTIYKEQKKDNDFSKGQQMGSNTELCVHCIDRMGKRSFAPPLICYL